MVFPVLHWYFTIEWTPTVIIGQVTRSASPNNLFPITISLKLFWLCIRNIYVLEFLWDLNQISSESSWLCKVLNNLIFLIVDVWLHVLDKLVEFSWLFDILLSGGLQLLRIFWELFKVVWELAWVDSWLSSHIVSLIFCQVFHFNLIWFETSLILSKHQILFFLSLKLS